MINLLLSYYKPYRKKLLAMLLLSLLVAALDLVFPILVRHILNVELPQKNIAHIFQLIGILFVMYCISFGLTYFMNYHGTLISVHMENDMRQDLFRHLEKMSFRYFDDNKTGQLLSRITTDLTEIGELTFKGPNDLIICSITMLGTIVILTWMNPFLASFIVLLLVMKTVHTVYINRKMKQRFRANRALYGDVSAQ
ncbi:MAG: ABC transporter ATP-binding protein, partial [Acidaminococcaceae bacterium]|nr:ABC transporter ATP-binding protein [Acidaminococcaceae bacterium]